MAPLIGNGQIIDDPRLRAPAGCVRYPSYGSYPAISPWLAIPDGSPASAGGWHRTPIIMGAGVASFADQIAASLNPMVPPLNPNLVANSRIPAATRGTAPTTTPIAPVGTIPTDAASTGPTTTELLKTAGICLAGGIALGAILGLATR